MQARIPLSSNASRNQSASQPRSPSNQSTSVRLSRSARPWLSQMACSFVFRPPLVRPIRRPRPPFSRPDWATPVRSWRSGVTITTPSGRTHRSGTKHRPKRAGRLSNLRAPRPARLPSPKPTTTKIKPADSRHERGTSGGHVTCSLSDDQSSQPQNLDLYRCRSVDYSRPQTFWQLYQPLTAHITAQLK